MDEERTYTSQIALRATQTRSDQRAFWYLDRDEKARVVGKRIKNAPHWQYGEGDQEQRLPAPRPRRASDPRSEKDDDNLGRDHAGRHEHHGGSAMPLRQHFAQQWQHGGVGEMKHDGTDQEDDQTAILQ